MYAISGVLGLGGKLSLNNKGLSYYEFWSIQLNLIKVPLFTPLLGNKIMKFFVLNNIQNIPLIYEILHFVYISY